MGTTLHDIPGDHLVQVAAIAHLAATATEDIALIHIPFACKIVEAGFVPAAAVTGVNTNTTNLNVINRESGAGVTELANYDLIAGNNLAAATPKVISAAPSTLLAAGATIALQAEKVGTGLNTPAGTFYIKVRGA